MTGALIGLLLSAGLLLIASGWARTRRPSLDQRLTPYVRDVHPYAVLPGRSHGVVEAVFGPSIRRASQVIGDLVGGSASVSRRLVRLGSPMTLEDFRIRQVLWGAGGLAVAIALSSMLWTERGTGVPILLVICVVGFVSGVLLCDNQLSSRVTAHEQELQAEFPVVADLLALAVAAGESPVAGLERIMKVCHGALSDELARVVSDIRTGTPMAQAFDALAARTGVTSIARFAEGLAIAVERGTPLVDVLHAQAADVREAGRRELMEAGGRKEVAMMVPVVFLILPVTIVFAFFPGYIGLHLTSGM
ncbi:type II secretion system F family protein [Aeromicrobium sp. 9AM]|uniref:type II secretion system F family protein n=1 Tax=Aeromicrobium sp. 9AM TaxID=2653126 RepID=UPI0012F459D6|nr:type II secretion system F family protein [Aeromicrobium sp. 9AM]VXB84443.1 Pilus assembly protein TadB [Aeromicrobium sp. 9AM]